MREQAKTDPPRDPLAGGAGRQRFPRRGGGAGGGYTVPEVSQSLIITRLEGRTPVPAREQLEAFASHQTSMAIYLSVQRIHRVAERLVEGGFTRDHPGRGDLPKPPGRKARAVRGTLADIGDAGTRRRDPQNGALILVGFLGDGITTQNCTQRI